MFAGICISWIVCYNGFTTKANQSFLDEFSAEPFLFLREGLILLGTHLALVAK
jgi:hypothetical protein